MLPRWLSLGVGENEFPVYRREMKQQKTIDEGNGKDKEQEQQPEERPLLTSLPAPM